MDVFLTVARYRTTGPVDEDNRAFTARFLADTADELPGFRDLRLFESVDGDMLVCVSRWELESSAREFCGAIRDGNDQIERAYGAVCEGITTLREARAAG